MIRRKINIFFVVLILASCQDDVERKIILSSGNVIAISPSSVSIVSTIVDFPGDGSGAAYGFCWSLHPTPTSDDFKVELTDISKPSSYESLLNDLVPDKQYYGRAYIREKNGSTSYGKEIDFINNLLPRFSESKLSQIRFNYLEVTTSLISIGTTGSITDHGHVWSVYSLPTIENDHTSLGPLTDPVVINSRIESFTLGNRYYVRPYVVVDEAVLYGEQFSIAVPSVILPGSWRKISLPSIAPFVILTVGDPSTKLYQFNFNQKESGWFSGSVSGITMPDKTISELPNIPVEREYVHGLMIDGKVYAGFGKNLESGIPYYKDLWCFDPATNSWTYKSDIPAGGEVLYFVTDGTYAYAVDWHMRVFRYTPSTNFWSQISTDGLWPQRHNYLNGAVVIGDRIYMMIDDGIMYFDIAVGTYFACASPPVPLVRPVDFTEDIVPNMFFEYDSHLYLIAGRQVFRYQHELDEFVERASLPVNSILDPHWYSSANSFKTNQGTLVTISYMLLPYNAVQLEFNYGALLYSE